MIKQSPEKLSEAGLYYYGQSDQVKCFYCDGGLRNWQSEDEPWQEHARWFEKCVFVRLVKGDDYIRQCVEERPPEKANLNLQSGPRTVTEEEIRRAMSQAIVKQVLSMGIDHSRVKMAIKKRLENSGNPFDTTEALISAAFSVQRSQERRTLNENMTPSGAVLVTNVVSEVVVGFTYSVCAFIGATMLLLPLLRDGQNAESGESFASIGHRNTDLNINPILAD